MQASIAESWEVPEAGNIRWFVHLLPSLTDFAFLLPPFLLFLFLPGARFLFSDGDTGWHIRTGEWIIEHGTVPKTDLFSFTKPHESWFAWEWGADVIFAVVHKAAGLGGVAFATVLLLGLISALLFRLTRTACGSHVLAFGFTLLAVCGSINHWLARPHLFSWLFILVFSHAILAAERGNLKPLFWLPLLMLLWTNLHGGFFVGIALLFASAIGAVVPALKRNQNVAAEAYRAARPFLLCALVCCGATFANPYGWRLHQHIAAYLRDSRLLDNIQEYQSVNFREPGSVFFECILILGVASAFWCLKREKIAAAITVLLWAHLALVAGRNFPIFGFIAVPWIACMTREFLSSARSVTRLKRISGTLAEMAQDFEPWERIERWHLASGVAVLFLALAFASDRPGFDARFNPKSFPVTAVAALQAAQPSRLFTSDQWADYLIYRFFPVERVFMDGRSDFYGYDFMTKYQHIMSAQYDWEQDLKQFSIDAVMVKPDAAIAAVLKQSPRWKTLFDDGSVILFRAQDNRFAGNQDAARSIGDGVRASYDQSAPRILTSNDFGPTPKTNERRSL